MDRKAEIGLATALVALAIVASEQFLTKPVIAGGGNPNLTPIAYFPLMGSSASAESVVVPTPHPVERPTATPTLPNPVLEPTETGVSNCNTDSNGNINCMVGTPVVSTPVNYIETATPTRTSTIDLKCPDGTQKYVSGNIVICVPILTPSTPVISSPGTSVASTPVISVGTVTSGSSK